ncbi:ABC-F family ATP-binding cassette domain-containing protein [Methylopila sp. Yamaguchi]|uniref:ABC-F family ATP-binding cassette domain-containing protein n=1 Tax=Methylopila sp. Yamaguchi TaxID=1437817 RepID=UPI000CBD7623|nr:ABC-F family ATP-binding cassette domain-containing protein [Methylopila sp. Yamaguchi]GBD48397.1 ABC transporter related protein [Methylopila sp. Yamaguchi]
MAPPLLLLKDVRLTFGGRPLLDGAEISVSAGERLGLVGRNGSGKSTLLKIAAGLVEADGGSRFVQPGATIRYLPQEPDLSGFATTRAYVEAGLAPGDDEHRAAYLLMALGLTGDEAPATLSGGEARRAALARTLAPEPDILLLDEPTNHLDLPAIEWLEAELKSSRSALVLISHDRRFLENLTRATLWLDRGRTRKLEKGFGAFEAWRDEQLAQEELERHKLDRQIEREKDWLRYGVTARRKRNMGRLRALDDLREKRRTQRKAQGSVQLTVTEGASSGALVVEAKSVSKAYDGRSIVADFSTRIARGDRIGLVGANGAGKTTLLNLLTGVLAPDEGVIRIGANVEIATLDQKRASLDPSTTLREALTHGRGDTVEVGGQTKHVVSYMKDFLFGPEQAGSPLSALSGGERGRLLLARALAQPSNLLVLDEPTNDLDLETLDLLQEMIGEYPGTVILVSHDRDFLDRTVDAVIASEGGGRWQEYAGGYADMIAQRGRGVDARGPAATPASEKPKATASPAAAPAARKKLSFKDQHALETLPKRIEKLEADIAKLAAKLADPQLYAKDPKAFAKTSDDLAKAEAEKAASEERWLELEMMREELAG